MAQRAKISIGCGNAAFEGDPSGELARILAELAEELATGDHDEMVHHGGKLKLRDDNGNTVGSFTVTLED